MDFSNRQNRFVRIHEVSEEYLADIEHKTQTDPFYPSYHIAPKHGLLNDPNGLSYFNGEHHIFYQWFPLGPVHGLKHWYHVSTKDFVNFTDRGIAMYPDQDYDHHGCYTGVGVPHDDQVRCGAGSGVWSLKASCFHTYVFRIADAIRPKRGRCPRTPGVFSQR